MLNAQLVRSERLAGVGQVARGVGHEFGNILLRIIGKTDLALLEKDVGKIHDHLKVVMIAAERAGVIVRNLQSFSKTEAILETREMSAPIDEAISLVNHEFVKASVKLEKDYRSKLSAKMDVGGMAQVFLNLIINAIHSMAKGGTLKIILDSIPGATGTPGVAVTISDSGSGIPGHVLARIFEFAFTTKGDRGSGLGLSISKEIVESHGGTLTVKTEEGKGTDFTVWLPAEG